VGEAVADADAVAVDVAVGGAGVAVAAVSLPPHPANRNTIAPTNRTLPTRLRTVGTVRQTMGRSGALATRRLASSVRVHFVPMGESIPGWAADLRKLRKAEGLSRAQLAARTGLSAES